MRASERQRWLLDRAHEAGRVDVTGTAALLDVTPATVRRDLTGLERAGLLRRVHGGAVPAPRGRAGPDTAAVDRIVEAALAEVAGAATLLLDAGSAPARLAALLPADRAVTVVTNALPIAAALAGRAHVTLRLLGGRVRGTPAAAVGRWTVEALGGLDVDVAVLAAEGFSARRGLSTTDPTEAAAKRAMLRAARHVVVLARAAAHGADRLARFGRLDQVDVLVTDAALPTADAARLAAAGPRVVRA